MLRKTVLQAAVLHFAAVSMHWEQPQSIAHTLWEVCHHTNCRLYGATAEVVFLYSEACQSQRQRTSLDSNPLDSVITTVNVTTCHLPVLAQYAHDKYAGSNAVFCSATHCNKATTASSSTVAHCGPSASVFQPKRKQKCSSAQHNASPPNHRQPYYVSTAASQPEEQPLLSA
jgi:hypothetical protein